MEGVTRQAALQNLSYSLIDMQTQQIVSFVTIKVAETGSKRISQMQGLPSRLGDSGIGH